MIAINSKYNFKKNVAGPLGSYFCFIINIDKSSSSSSSSSSNVSNNSNKQDKITELELERIKNIYTFFGWDFAIENKDTAKSDHQFINDKSEHQLIKSIITESVKNVNLTSKEDSTICKIFRDKVVLEKSIVDDLQNDIYKKYPNLDPNKSVLIPIYYKVPSFENIIWLRLPAFINNELILEYKIQKISSDWLCRDKNNAITVKKSPMILEKQNWIHNFNKTWMDGFSRLYSHWSFNYTPYFYLLEYAYTTNTKFEINGIPQRGLVGIILMYCMHNSDGKIKLLNFATINLSAKYRRNIAYEDFENLLNKNTEAKIFYCVNQNTYIEYLFYNNIYPWSGLILDRFHDLHNFLSLISLTQHKKSKELCLDRLYDKENKTKNKHHCIIPGCSLCNGINLLLNLGSKRYQARWKNYYSIYSANNSYVDKKCIQKPYYTICGEYTFICKPLRPIYLQNKRRTHEELRIKMCKCDCDE